MGGIIAIYDSDLTYAIRLMEYIKKRKELIFEVLVFTEEDSLLDFGRNRTIDILIMEDGLTISEEIKDNIKTTFILSDYINKLETKEVNRVLKYQSAQILITNILSTYRMLHNKDYQNYRADNPEIVTIIALTPESNKLGFAWSYAYNISNCNKILFIPLELLPTPFLDACDYSKSSLSDFLYYLKNKDSQLISIMNSQINHIDSLSYLSGISIGLDLISMTKEDISLWIEKMKVDTDYDLIVFYLGYYSEAAVELIKQSDEIFIPMIEQSEDQYVISELERQLDFLDVKIPSEKIHKIDIVATSWSRDNRVSYQELKYSEAWKSAARFLEGDRV